jgi:hypothetical protein
MADIGLGIILGVSVNMIVDFVFYWSIFGGSKKYG